MDRWKSLVADSLAAALAFAGAARAENECGTPEARQEVVCSPSTYDPAQGNIFYSYDENSRNETSGDFAIRLTRDPSIDYDRDRPGDDVWVFPEDHDVRIYSAVWISPGEFGEYTGDISLHSSTDVTSNGRGIRLQQVRPGLEERAGLVGERGSNSAAEQHPREHGADQPVCPEVAVEGDRLRARIPTAFLTCLHDGPRKMASPRSRLVCSRTGIEPANDDTHTAATISIDGLLHLSVNGQRARTCNAILRRQRRLVGCSFYSHDVTTRAGYRRHARRERSEWPREDCIPGSPWTGGSLRFGNRLRRTFGCGSIRRLSA